MFVEQIVEFNPDICSCFDSFMQHLPYITTKDPIIIVHNILIHRSCIC